jgi:hypothetical protein
MNFSRCFYTTNKLGFKTIVFFMDKIDEDTQIGGNIKQEADLPFPKSNNSLYISTGILSCIDTIFC